MNRDERRIEQIKAIVAYCRCNTGQPLTLAGVAHGLGRSPGRLFTQDLAAARHMALDVGEEITNAAWDSTVKSYVFYHLHADAEDGKAMPPLVTANRQIRTRIRNVGRHGEFLSTNGTNAADRGYGRITALLAKGAEYNLLATEEIEVQIQNKRESV